jgi:hypothetical protein
MKLKIQNNFITNLPADPDLENSPRQVKKACYSYVVRPNLLIRV